MDVSKIRTDVRSRFIFNFEIKIMYMKICAIFPIDSDWHPSLYKASCLDYFGRQFYAFL
jgi:hypothetical protein